MADAQTVYVSQLLDKSRIGSFQFKLIFWSVLLVLIDGYDIGAVSFALPSLIKDWGISPRDAGPVLSASIAGMLFGSGVFGYIGDRYGRKVALIGSNLLFGVLTLAAAYSTNLHEMTMLRFFAGLGIGGVIPNVIALNAESAPRCLHGTMALIAIALVPIGGAIAGLIAAMLVPTYGWQILFYVGGLAPIGIAICSIFFLSESIKFMALHARYRSALEKLIRRVRPDFVVPSNPIYVLEDEKNFARFNPSHLFGDGLAMITPLLWVIFALNLMGFYFLASWTPTLLVTAAHLPQQVGALAGTMLLIGGTIGPLVFCRWMDKRRFLAIAILSFCAVPVVASVGWFGVRSEASLMIAAFLAGFLVLSIQPGLNVAGALIYPTSLRSNGSGWQLGIGRLGSIIGPLLGAAFVTLPVQELYRWAAIPFGVSGLACLVVQRLLQTRRKAQVRIGEQHQPSLVVE